MATVAPALFPEMKRRGHKPKEMIALLATGAAMADTVPPSIVLIVLGSVGRRLDRRPVHQRLRHRHGPAAGARRSSPAGRRATRTCRACSAPRLRLIGRTALIAAPALVLPFLIRSAVAAASPPPPRSRPSRSLYALFIGMVLYGGISLTQMLRHAGRDGGADRRDPADPRHRLAMAWAITQAGFARDVASFMASACRAAGSPSWSLTHRRLPDPGLRARGPARHRADGTADVPDRQEPRHQRHPLFDGRS